MIRNLTRRRPTLTVRPGRGEAGFTLIELLVVITILGILAAIVVFSVGGIQDRGKGSAVAADRTTLQTAEETYCAQHGSYASQDQLVQAHLLAGRSTYNDIVLGTGAKCGSTSYNVVATQQTETTATAPPSYLDQPGGVGSVGQGPIAEVVNPTTGMVYVEDLIDNDITAFNPADQSFTKIPLLAGAYSVALIGLQGGTIGQGFGLLAVNPTTNALYVAVAGGQQIVELDINPSDRGYNKPVGTVSLPGGDQASGLLVDSANGRNMVYVLGSSFSPPPLHLYGLNGSFQSSPSVTPISLFPNGSSGFSRLISRQANTNGGFPTYQQMMALDPTTDQLYLAIRISSVAGPGDSPLLVVDLAHNNLVTPIPVPCVDAAGAISHLESDCNFSLAALAVDTVNNQVYASGVADGAYDLQGNNATYSYIWQVSGTNHNVAIGYRQTTDQYGSGDQYAARDDEALALTVNNGKLYTFDLGGFGPGQDPTTGISLGTEVRFSPSTSAPICAGGPLSQCQNMMISELNPHGSPNDAADVIIPAVNTFDNRVYDPVMGSDLTQVAVNVIDQSNVVSNIAAQTGNYLVAADPTKGSVYVVNAGSHSITTVLP